MQISDEALQFVKDTLGFRARPYKNTKSQLCIGYNHVIAPGDGVADNDIINAHKATSLLYEDIQKALVGVDVPKNITQDEFDTLVLSELLW
jgi:GH24 family phage-related lysozyme (muramidase)